MNISRPATWKKSELRRALLVAGLFASLSGVAAAEDELAPAPVDNTPSLLSSLNLNGSLRGTYWSVSNNPAGRNDFGVAELWLKAAPHLGEKTALNLEGWTRASNEISSDSTHSLLREGYLDTGIGAVDFRIGKQIIVWGKADQLNPTDNLSPRDNALFIAESDDQRRGTVAAKGTYNFSDDYSGMAATAIWLPRFKPNIQPIPPTPGVTFSETIPTGDQYAVKLEQSGKAVDWSMSYFRGYDLNADIAAQAALPGVMLLQHHRIRVLGADAATVLGRYGLRAEMAYTQTEDAAGIDPFIKNPFFYGVLGADRTYFEYLNINLQYFQRRITNYSDPNAVADPLTRSVAIQQSIISNQQDNVQHGLSMRIADKWLHETLEAELAVVYNLTRSDYLLRPKIAYAFDDHWKGLLGATLFRGDADTFFGMLRDRSAVFGELRYSF